jgi:hypothetical protein
MVVGWMTRGSPSEDMELTPLKQVQKKLLATPIRYQKTFYISSFR